MDNVIFLNYAVGTVSCILQKENGDKSYEVHTFQDNMSVLR